MTGHVVLVLEAAIILGLLLRRPAARLAPSTRRRIALYLPAATQLGAMAAAEVIQHIGARPQTSLSDLAKAKRLLG